jgi:hypothetical protein
MTELNRTEAELTTADIAARTTTPGTISQVPSEAERDDMVTRDSVERATVRNDATNRRDWETTPVIRAEQRVQDDFGATPLFSDSDIGDLRSRWSTVQTEFVDEPRRAVAEADQLVATVMQRLADGFAKERGSLEKQWDSGETASTEDLRMALQRYRAFFNRLLNAA